MYPLGVRINRVPLYVHLYDLVFKPFVCAAEPAIGDVITACVLEDEIIHTVLDDVNNSDVLEDAIAKSVIDVVIPSSGLDNWLLNDVITVSLLNDTVADGCKLVEKDMGYFDGPDVSTVLVEVIDVEKLSLEQFTATYDALKPAREMSLSDLNITNRWFEEE